MRLVVWFCVCCVLCDGCLFVCVIVRWLMLCVWMVVWLLYNVRGCSFVCLVVYWLAFAVVLVRLMFAVCCCLFVRSFVCLLVVGCWWFVCLFVCVMVAGCRCRRVGLFVRCGVVCLFVGCLMCAIGCVVLCVLCVV